RRDHLCLFGARRVVGVALRRLDVLVAHPLLNRPDRHAGRGALRAERVPQAAPALFKSERRGGTPQPLDHTGKSFTRRSSSAVGWACQYHSPVVWPRPRALALLPASRGPSADPQSRSSRRRNARSSPEPPVVGGVASRRSAIAATEGAYMRRWGLSVLGVLVVAGAAASMAVASSASTTTVVKALEKNKVVINKYIQSGNRYSPGTVTVKSGSLLTFKFGDNEQDVHTLTIAPKAQLPHTVAQVNACNVC